MTAVPTPTRKPPMPIFAAGPSVTDLEVRFVTDSLVSGAYDKPYYYVEQFQKEFAAWHGRKHAVMTPNCTTAIHLLLAALGVKDGDEVIVPELTWIGSTAGISHVRATPVFADVEPGNWCIDPASVEKRITPRTKAIIAVGLHGNMPAMDALQEIAERRKVHLIEDAAQSLGSTYKGRKSGTFGIASVFSFHRTKTLSTVEGGMLITDDDKLHERCMFLRDHGRSKTIAYYNLEVAFKYIPTNMQAALGLAQLRRLDELVATKRRIFEWYRDGLAGLSGLDLNPDPPEGFNSVWVPGLVFAKKLGISKPQAMEHMTAWGLPARPFFYPLSSLPAYGQEAKYRPLNPVAYDLSSRGVNLPSAMNLEKAGADYVNDCITQLVRR